MAAGAYLCEEKKEIHRVTLFERYLHLHRISLCFQPYIILRQVRKMSGMSPWQHISIRPAPPGRFLLSFFKSCRDKKNRPDVFHFVGTISSVSCVENEGLAQRILALVAITSTASGILTSTVLGAALAFGCNSRGFL